MATLPGSGEGRVFEQLQALLLSTTDVEQFSTELAQVAAGVVEGPSSCGITMRYDANVLTVGSSDDRAALLDESQYRAGAGPCLEAMATDRVIVIADAAAEMRWPDYMRAAREAGLAWSLSLPLKLRAEPFGAMNVYGFDGASPVGDTERRQVELFAAQAAGTLWVATRQMKDATLLAQMEEALRSRTVIDQAMGIIMAQQQCTAGVAFDLLRRESRTSRRRLRDVAAGLVARVSGHPPEPGRDFDTG